MSLTAVITQNISAQTQNIIFSTSGQVEEITYSNNQITYAAESSFVLSQSDFSLFAAYKLQFYNALLSNYPNINTYFNIEIPVCLIEIQSLSGPNIIQFHQTSTASPVSLIYNISFDRGALTATFAAQSNQITITLQEFLLAYQMLRSYFNQCQIA